MEIKAVVFVYYYTNSSEFVEKSAQTAYFYLCKLNKNPHKHLHCDIEYSTISTETQTYNWAEMPIVKGEKLYKAIFSRRQINDVPEYFDCVSDLLNDPTVKPPLPEAPPGRALCSTRRDTPRPVPLRPKGARPCRGRGRALLRSP